MSSPPARVYVVDDDPVLREGVVQWLGDAGYEARAFASGESLLADLPRLAPGCIVADISMPDMSGLELQQRLLAAGCRWPVIVITGHASRLAVASAMGSGVLAFLEKPVREAELLGVLIKGQAQLHGKAEVIPDPQLARRFARLTSRERQVLGFILQKKLNKQIGAILGIAETTVKGYRRGLMRKLGVANTTELVVLAIHAGLYDPAKS